MSNVFGPRAAAAGGLLVLSIASFAGCREGTGSLQRPGNGQAGTAAEAEGGGGGSAGLVAGGGGAAGASNLPPDTPDLTLTQYSDREQLDAAPKLAPIDTDTDFEHQTERYYLSGKGFSDPVTWDFFCNTGRKSGEWSTIGVPSNWELYGFGNFTYGGPRLSEEEGQYRRTFRLPSGWEEKRVFLVFEGAMTDTEVWINEQSAGPVHRGGFYRFQHDITELVDPAEPNLLQVTVAKDSAEESINDAEREADYWVFGGIYRPVYLAATPPQFIERIAVDARAGGALSVDVFLQHLEEPGQVVARLFDQELQPVGDELAAAVDAEQDEVSLAGQFSNILPWSDEAPHRYRLAVELHTDSGVSHAVRENIGFRTIEVVAGDGIMINGTKALLKGINRHSFWPNTGRALSAELSLYDVRLLKSMNVNAVRSSHYPPDQHFLDTCDREGLYVLDELAGWQKPYAPEIGAELIREMVTFDVNHPSIIFWDNGNEWGWQGGVDREFARWDPQARAVLHPGALNSSVYAPHYQSYDAAAESLAEDNIYLTTEFVHAMYDQGGGAALEDFWGLIRTSPVGAGGFIWAFIDEGVYRADADLVDTEGNSAPDGVFGPYRQKEGSYHSIRQIWSPVVIDLPELPADFDGTVPVENRYQFRDLSEVSFNWSLVRFDYAAASSEVTDSGTAQVGEVAPGEREDLQLELPSDWSTADALQLDAVGENGELLARWSWLIPSALDTSAAIVETTSEQAAVVVDAEDDADALRVRAGALEVEFSRATGRLQSVQHGEQAYSFGNGPALLGGDGELQGELAVATDGEDVSITASYTGELEEVHWRVLGNGWLSLSYRYTLAGEHDYFGIAFDYPEDQVTGAEWLGRGPDRVWKNRMQGPWHDVWKRDYNNGITGQRWDYPEFKGYFADVRWARILTTEGPIHLVLATDEIFLGLLKPRDGGAPREGPIVYPDSDIALLHGISPIGTFTLGSAELGPQGQPHMVDGTFEGSVFFYFGDTADAPLRSRSSN